MKLLKVKLFDIKISIKVAVVFCAKLDSQYLFPKIVVSELS